LAFQLVVSTLAFLKGIIYKNITPFNEKKAIIAPMRRRLVLFLWLLGMLFPISALRAFPSFRMRFDNIFNHEWSHIFLHLVLFALLTIMLVINLKIRVVSKKLIAVFIIVLVVAILQETFQLIIKGRGPGWPEFFDLAVDLIGFTLGIILWRWVPRFLYSHKLTE
jgi:VanZ family protein